MLPHRRLLSGGRERGESPQLTHTKEGKRRKSRGGWSKDQDVDVMMSNRDVRSRLINQRRCPCNFRTRRNLHRESVG